MRELIFFFLIQRKVFIVKKPYYSTVFLMVSFNKIAVFTKEKFFTANFYLAAFFDMALLILLFLFFNNNFFFTLGNYNLGPVYFFSLIFAAMAFYVTLRNKSPPILCAWFLSGYLTVALVITGVTTFLPTANNPANNFTYWLFFIPAFWNAFRGFLDFCLASGIISKITMPQHEVFHFTNVGRNTQLITLSAHLIMALAIFFPLNFLGFYWFQIITISMFLTNLLDILLKKRGSYFTVSYKMNEL